MSWHLVEESESVKKHFETSHGSSNETQAHSIWRCGNCRALAVTLRGTTMSGECGKCHAGG